MRIGFYAPLKAPDHPVPSGDRQMARGLVAALRHAGHEVDIYSRFRSFTSMPDAAPLAGLRETAAGETARVAAAWAAPIGRPDCLFTYHPYYKAPDLLGPALAARFALPYITAEASLAERRATGPWAERQRLVDAAVRGAVLNLCFTARDRTGLSEAATPGSLVDLPPFIDAAPFGPRIFASGGPVRLITVAMMRPGDKLDSYRFLARALACLPDADWSLTIVGEGSARTEVVAAFAGTRADRVRFLGAVSSDEVPGLMRQADMLVWPGFNEAFGLCYLEAQASGLPVVAVHNAGTPSVIRHGETGLLTEAEPATYAAAVARLIGDARLQARFGAAAASFVHGERGIEAAAATLDAALRDHLPRPVRPPVGIQSTP